ncbi:MAG: TraX family protein [Lachnospiraceae bacterium]
MKRLKILSGAQLKYIAFLTMLIDHVNKALIYPNLNGGMLLVISDFFDIVGRIAFPIFIFLLIEGFFKTTNRWKYLGMLLLFGVISEIPFDLFTTATFFEPNWNNIMFTLALVLVIIWCIDTLKEKMGMRWRIVWYLISAVIVGAGCLSAMILGLDYEYHAVLIGYFLYIFHEKPVWAIPFCYLSMYKEPWALSGFGLTLTYNGERGKQNKIVNYLFYPVHLLILGMIRIYFGF